MSKAAIFRSAIGVTLASALMAQRGSPQPRRLREVIRDVSEKPASALLLAPLDQSPLDRGNEHAVAMNAVAQFVAQNGLAGDTRRAAATL